MRRNKRTILLHVEKLCIYCICLFFILFIFWNFPRYSQGDISVNTLCDKEFYVPGDAVKLIVKFESRKKLVLEFYQEMNLSIFLSGLDESPPIYLESRKGKTYMEPITPDKPFIYVINGVIKQTEKGNFFVDFDAFGKGKFIDNEFLIISAAFYEAKYPFLSSREPVSSNQVVIRLKKNDSPPKD